MMPIFIEEKKIDDLERRKNDSNRLLSMDNKQKSQNSSQYIFRFWKIGIFAIAILAHIILILGVKINVNEKKEKQDYRIFKMVDIEEFVPLPPEPVKKEKRLEPEKQIVLPEQDTVAENIIEVDEEVLELINYLPQHKISAPPKIPIETVLSNIQYPALANKQRIEGVVFLELYIDQRGNIRDIKVLKDPGYGLAEAAVKALSGIICKPAYVEEKAVAVRFRYPVRFKLK